MEYDNTKSFHDKNVTNQFTRHSGERAAHIDKRLGIDYDIYQTYYTNMNYL